MSYPLSMQFTHGFNWSPSYYFLDPYSAVAFYAGGQWALGCFVVTMLPRGTVRRMAPAERHGMALLLGLFLTNLPPLWLFLAGYKLTLWMWLIPAACGFTMVIASPQNRRALVQFRDRMSASSLSSAALATERLMGLTTALVALTLFSWVVWTARTTITTDYDGLAIWSYRTRVLVHEGVFRTPSLLDPVRLVPMAHHPYLLPVMEAGFCHVLRQFRFAFTHIPHVMAYGAYLLIGWGAAGALRRRHLGRGWLMVACLPLLPGAAEQVAAESVREPIMGFFGLAAVVSLARWAESPRLGHAVLAALFAIGAQQIKVEGTALAAGVAVGGLLVALAAPPRAAAGGRTKRLRDWAIAVAIAGVIATPWALALRTIPPSSHSYSFGVHSRPNLSALVAGVPAAARLLLTELFARPEVYGLAPFCLVWGLWGGWSRRNAVVRLALLAGPMAVLVPVMVVYLDRQGLLPADRNVTFSRRIMVAFPALAFAALYLPRTTGGRYSAAPSRAIASSRIKSP